ncbi:MAG: OmpA family protein [Nitrospirae bacterium]|nr:OmpA family protein [Nitrospirota bacterium]
MNLSKSGLLISVVAIALLSGCVSSSKYRALEESSKAERVKSQEKLAALLAQKESLGKDLAVLREQKQNAETEIASLNDRLAQMQRQAAEIAAQKDEEINRLKGTYENLVKDLKGEIEKGEIKVTQIRDRLTVNLVEKILFDSGKAEVKAQGKEVLKKVGNILKDVKDKDIRIEGYTDNVRIGGTLREKFPTNWELSTQRATNVLRFLQDEGGVDGTRLAAVGFGEFRPLAGNDTPDGRAQNRRIEIVLVPSDIQGVLKELK